MNWYGYFKCGLLPKVEKHMSYDPTILLQFKYHRELLTALHGKTQ